MKPSRAKIAVAAAVAVDTADAVAAAAAAMAVVNSIRNFSRPKATPLWVAFGRCVF
jgi:hypothetical protein